MIIAADALVAVEGIFGLIVVLVRCTSILASDSMDPLLTVWTLAFEGEDFFFSTVAFLHFVQRMVNFIFRLDFFWSKIKLLSASESTSGFEHSLSVLSELVSESSVEVSVLASQSTLSLAASFRSASTLRKIFLAWIRQA